MVRGSFRKFEILFGSSSPVSSESPEADNSKVDAYLERRKSYGSSV
jgi:hypothetical protein